ncbi:hypothetical protein J8I87_07075 [Paraburkholderia sp. LEh10]|uniref:hypothetical protein n=1 Tax=Paraburkholderia sp. LEh10 TaxID=2821353 RepID=UPI001AE953BC|nr:hypothetical protein [Paraburkholderia sp. LEh10]MBP0589484.1 hypothetical protein [Paraburkholderia sp. LEh10]
MIREVNVRNVALPEDQTVLVEFKTTMSSAGKLTLRWLGSERPGRGDYPEIPDLKDGFAGYVFNKSW